MEKTPIIISLEDYEISKNLRTLGIRYKGHLMPNALKYVGDSIPKIKNIILSEFGVECVCVNVKNVCFVCYKEFLKVCTNAFEKSCESKNPFHISMSYANCKPYNNLIIASIFEEYLNFRHSYRFVIRTERYEKVRNNLLDIGISLAHKRPDIEINFKVDSDLTEEILCYKDIVTSETISFLKTQMFYCPQRGKRVERV